MNGRLYRFAIVLVAIYAITFPRVDTATSQNSTPHTQSIVVMGDSISAEYGLARDTGWVKLLAQRLRYEHRDYNVINVSISGETTSGGKTRLPDVLARERPSIVVIELGGNDGLRGLPVSEISRNLADMIELCQNVHARVMLVGVRLPPNYGRLYTERFAAVYTDLAQRYHTTLVPFIFDGFATNPASFQPDHIHPTEAAQPIMMATVWATLKPMLR